MRNRVIFFGDSPLSAMCLSHLVGARDFSVLAVACPKASLLRAVSKKLPVVTVDSVESLPSGLDSNMIILVDYPETKELLEQHDTLLNGYRKLILLTGMSGEIYEDPIPPLYFADEPPYSCVYEIHNSCMMTISSTQHRVPDFDPRITPASELRKKVVGAAYESFRWFTQDPTVPADPKTRTDIRFSWMSPGTEDITAIPLLARAFQGSRLGPAYLEYGKTRYYLTPEER